MGFKEDRQIDPNNLAVECLKQADLMGKWATKSAKARASVMRLDTELELKEAEIDTLIRLSPKDFGLDKLTVDGIKSKITLDKDIIRLKAQIIDAKEEMMVIDAGVKSIEQKDRQLSNLVKLHGQNYFISGNAPTDLSEMWENQRNSKESALNKKVLKKKRKQ